MQNEPNPLTASLNIPALTEVAEWLEAGTPKRGDVVAFDMSDFYRDARTSNAREVAAECGTACCIAGTAVAFDNMKNGTMRRLDNDFLARSLLGLDIYQADSLFYPHGWGGDEGARDIGRGNMWSNIAPAHAARVIRHLMATGVVDWNLPEAA